MALTITDEEFQRQELHLFGETDAQAIVYLLALHKVCENKTSGDLRHLLAFEAAAILHVLRRLAPETLEDALAIWEEETDDGS